MLQSKYQGKCAESARCGEDAQHAARMLADGHLVAFPTETVYGLGADALNEAAVARIFEVKGRPADHPLIIHLASVDHLGGWAADLPETALRLAEAFWPGPLTLILRKAASVSAIVTGGQDTIGLRVPAHPLALEMLRAFAGGVAAPSANRFGRVSPTTAEHVRADLGGDADYILDGGPCGIGIESTILDLTRSAPLLLRPGAISAEQLAAVLGSAPITLEQARREQGSDTLDAVRSPGTLPQHYSPRARVELCCGAAMVQRAGELLRDEQGDDAPPRVCALSAQRPAGLANEVQWRALPAAAADAAHELYALLRGMDAEGADVILACPPEPIGIGAAVADRLRRAAGLGSLPEAP